jgi:hypothetical protein
LNNKYATNCGGKTCTGAMPSEVNDWLNDTIKSLDKRSWKGRNGWMGWSSILFGDKEHLCYKVSNKLVCEQFIGKFIVHYNPKKAYCNIVSHFFLLIQFSTFFFE